MTAEALKSLERFLGERGDDGSGTPEDYDRADAALALVRSRLVVLEQALAGVDAMLTTVAEDNVPRGEACKLQARAIARSALGRAVSVADIPQEDTK